MARKRRLKSSAMLAVAVMLLAVLVAGCRDDTTSSTPASGIIMGTPTARGAITDMPEQIDISVSDGEFDTREIRLTAGVPTMMMVTNEDDEAYTLRIEDLVTDTEIAAGETTEVSFTTPASGTYEATLLSDGGEELATTVVVVQDPGGGT